MGNSMSDRNRLSVNARQNLADIRVLRNAGLPTNRLLDTLCERLIDAIAETEQEWIDNE